MKTALLTGPAIFDSGRENQPSGGLNTVPTVRKYQPASQPASRLSDIVRSILVIKSDDRALLRDVHSLANLLTVYRDKDTRYDLAYRANEITFDRINQCAPDARARANVTFSVQCNFTV